MKPFQDHIIASTGELLVEIMRPENDVPLDRPGTFTGPFPSGAPAIFIDAAARLGCRTRFFGLVGDDAFGRAIVERLRCDGVDVSGIGVMPEAVTGTAFVGYAVDGSREFVFNLKASASAFYAPQHINAESVRDISWLHISGSSLALSDACRDVCYRLVETVKSHGGRIAFDPNYRKELIAPAEMKTLAEPILAMCDVFLPSGGEAMLFSGADSPEEGCRWHVQQGLPLVALKLAEQGCRLFSTNEEIWVPGCAVDAVDPTGAGDCFASGVVAGLIQQLPLKSIGRLANACGALATTRLGPMEGAAFPDAIHRLAFAQYSCGVLFQ